MSNSVNPELDKKFDKWVRCIRTAIDDKHEVKILKEKIEIKKEFWKTYKILSIDLEKMKARAICIENGNSGNLNITSYDLEQLYNHLPLLYRDEEDIKEKEIKEDERKKKKELKKEKKFLGKIIKKDVKDVIKDIPKDVQTITDKPYGIKKKIKEGVKENNIEIKTEEKMENQENELDQVEENVEEVKEEEVKEEEVKEEEVKEEEVKEEEVKEEVDETEKPKKKIKLTNFVRDYVINNQGCEYKSIEEVVNNEGLVAPTYGLKYYLKLISERGFKKGMQLSIKENKYYIEFEK